MLQISAVLALSLPFASTVFAQALDDYCITKVGHKLQSKPIVSSIDEPAPVNIIVNGKPFRIVVKDRYLIVMDENNKALNKVSVGQKFGRVHNVILGKNGWLWIDGDERGYMVKLNIDKTSPTLGEPVQLPDLKAKPCSVFNKWFGNCYFREVGAYSSLLDRVFITGHRVTLLGSDSLASYEMIAGQAKLLPAQLQGARLIGGTRHAEVGGMGYYYYEDLPNLNGVLFEGRNGEAFFYDGVNVTSLLVGYSSDFAKKENLKNLSRWYVETTRFSKRNFLTNYATHDLLKVKPYIIEMRSGPTLIPISISDELSKGWLKFFDFPNDRRLFGIVGNYVSVEINEELRIIATVPASSVITGTQARDGTIALTIYNPATQSSDDYFLVHNSTPEKCIAIPNTDKPIEFGNDN